MALMVKICGINSVEAADAAARAGADFAGLVFHPKSPRHLTPDAARALSQRLRGRLRLVVLMADPHDEDVLHAVNNTVPDFLQLHGAESPARVSELRAKFGLPIIKALPIADASDFGALPAYEDAADMLLFDAKAPANAERGGGHGVAFDWQLLRSRTISRPWFLAGGLNAENVARAVAASNPPGVDVSSGVETAPGVKNADMIQAFVAAARNAHFAGAAA
ncbi:MAG TPA: phosphoribosylanthranilate isomerase [Rhizomicrobium sp.]|nr:phosphoribosylanthranilate isomerase [Rhizomicrobium sp.]